MDMARVDFHTGMPDPIAYCCRLIRKAYSSGQRMVVLLRDRSQLQQLDDNLWTFSDLDFLPHVSAQHPHAAQTPIVLTADALEPWPQADLLINLSNQEPEGFGQFARMIELVAADQAQAARGRYRKYQQDGHQVEHFDARPK